MFAVLAVLGTVAILLARIPLSYLASRYFADNLLPMGLAPTIGSCISVLICALAYVKIKKRLGNGEAYE